MKFIKIKTLFLITLILITVAVSCALPETSPPQISDIPVTVENKTMPNKDSGAISSPDSSSDAPSSNFHREDEDILYNNYTVTLDINPQNRLVTGIQKVRFTNKSDTAMDFIYFNLNLNAFRKDGDAKPYLPQMEAKIFETGIDYGYTDIQNVTINREAVPYENYGQTLKITLPETLPPNVQTEIMLQFESYIPKINHRTGANDYAMWCGNFLPSLGVYDEYGWHTASYYPVGDPFFTEISNYNVTINAPLDYIVAATGVEETSESDGIRTTTVNVKLVRDFAFALSNRYMKSTLITSSGTEVNMYTYSRDINTGKFLDIAERSLSYFSELLSNYPYRQLDIVETGLFISSGMEYPQLVFMDSAYLYTDASYNSLAHEIGHQWFYNIIGNNQIKEAWIDEGLVSFLQEGISLTKQETDEKLLQEYGRLKSALPDIENKGMLSDLSVYRTWQDYYNIQYRRGKLMFYSLKLKMGEIGFNEFLKLYYSKYAYKITNRKELIQTAEEVYGGSLADFFDGWLQNFDLPALNPS